LAGANGANLTCETAEAISSFVGFYNSVPDDTGKTAWGWVKVVCGGTTDVWLPGWIV
jgi:hypothetical protein